MTRHITSLLFLLSVGFLTFSTNLSYSQFIYDWIDTAELGYSLSGHVEFDTIAGTNGSPTNLVDFSFNVTGPKNYGYSYQSPNDVTDSNFSLSHIDITPTEIIYNPLGAGSLKMGNLSGSGPTLIWNGGAGIRIFSHYGSFDSVGNVSWNMQGPEKSIVIAKRANFVPEPTSVLLFGLSFATYFAMNRR